MKRLPGYLFYAASNVLFCLPPCNSHADRMPNFTPSPIVLLFCQDADLANRRTLTAMIPVKVRIIRGNIRLQKLVRQTCQMSNIVIENITYCLKQIRLNKILFKTTQTLQMKRLSSQQPYAFFILRSYAYLKNTRSLKRWLRMPLSKLIHNQWFI